MQFRRCAGIGASELSSLVFNFLKLDILRFAGVAAGTAGGAARRVAVRVAGVGAGLRLLCLIDLLAGGIPGGRQGFGGSVDAIQVLRFVRFAQFVQAFFDVFFVVGRKFVAKFAQLLVLGRVADGCEVLSYRVANHYIGRFHDSSAPTGLEIDSGQVCGKVST